MIQARRDKMKTFRILAAAVAGLAFAGLAQAAGGAKHPHAPEGGWPFEGPTGQYDMASVQPSPALPAPGASFSVSEYEARQVTRADAAADLAAYVRRQTRR
jgi:hypothetical protein